MLPLAGCPIRWIFDAWVGEYDFRFIYVHKISIAGYNDVNANIGNLPTRTDDGAITALQISWRQRKIAMLVMPQELHQLQRKLVR